MSAIAGVYHTDRSYNVLERGSSLMDALAQYPCDNAQAWYADGIYLGCHNQWITTESAGEANPCYDGDCGAAIASDAIIDNRDELFRLLDIGREEKPVITDTRLIMLAYMKWGERCPEYLIGDFAFMIWDDREKKLFGARDFSGSRTLYYCRDERRFAFCTVMEPLCLLPGVEKRLNEQWLAEYLAIAGMVDVADTSITPLIGIAQLPPAHSVSVSEGKLVLRRYCTLTEQEEIRYASDDQYVEAFKEVFSEAVAARTRTFRQVGAQLSGGLDSGAIVSFAAGELRRQQKPLHTFSYVPKSDFVDYTPRHMMPDERPYIDSTVRHIGGIEAHYMDFPDRDSYTEIDGMLDVMEMPYKFFVNSFWLKGIFEDAQGLDIGLLLNGGRGNLSISWGNALSYYGLLLKRLRWIRLAAELRQYSLNMGVGRKRLMSYVGREAFPIINRIRPPHEKYVEPMLIAAEFARRTNVYQSLRQYGFDRSGNAASDNARTLRKLHFQQLYQWNASNTLAAKLSVRHSLWKRDPSNDIRVIRYCLSLPEEQYVQNGLDRSLIRRATDKLLPDQVRLNQRVRGVQGADWAHRVAPRWRMIASEVDAMCNDKCFADFVDNGLLREANTKLKAGIRAEDAYEDHLRVLMNSLIVYRYIKKFI